MSDEMVREAIQALTAAKLESAALRESLPGLIVERRQWERAHRRLLLVLAALTVIVGVVLLDVRHTLEIVEDVTGPAGQARSRRSTAAAVCAIANENRAIHGLPPLECEAP